MLLPTNGCFLSNHIPFPYVTNQNLVLISRNCSHYWERANHSTCLTWAIKMASLDDERVFSLVASKFKIFYLNTHQKRATSWKWGKRRFRKLTNWLRKITVCGEERCVTRLRTAAKETIEAQKESKSEHFTCQDNSLSLISKLIISTSGKILTDNNIGTVVWQVK